MSNGSYPPVFRWKFLEQSNREWVWHRMPAEGKTGATSDRLPTFGAAISSALQEGFRPKTQGWAVIDREGITTTFDAASGATPSPRRLPRDPAH